MKPYTLNLYQYVTFWSEGKNVSYYCTGIKAENTSLYGTFYISSYKDEHRIYYDSYDQSRYQGRQWSLMQ